MWGNGEYMLDFTACTHVYRLIDFHSQYCRRFKAVANSLTFLTLRDGLRVTSTQNSKGFMIVWPVEYSFWAQALSDRLLLFLINWNTLFRAQNCPEWILIYPKKKFACSYSVTPNESSLPSIIIKVADVNEASLDFCQLVAWSELCGHPINRIAQLSPA